MRIERLETQRIGWIAAGLAAAGAAIASGCAGGTTSSLLPPAMSAAPPANGDARIVEPGERVEATVAVASISGPPQSVWDRLVRQLNTASQDANIALLNYQGASADYRLQGYVIASPAKKSVSISYIWDVFDKSGARVGRTAGSQSVDRGGGGDPWAAIPDPVLKLIADQAVLAVRTRSTQQGIAKAAPRSVTPLPVAPPRVAPAPAPTDTAKARREDAALQPAVMSR